MDVINHVLIVGAGGIGCEVVSRIDTCFSYKMLTIVDYDEIDKTNLNRQFIFKLGDVGKAKSHVLANFLKKRRNVKINDYYMDIESFVQKFYVSKELYDTNNILPLPSVIISALDNVPARQFLNRFASIIKVNVIEAGSAGYLGQGRLIPHSLDRNLYSSCFECSMSTRQEERTYPVCTIRATPTKFIHCVFWAKYLHDAISNRDSSENLSDLIEPIISADWDPIKVSKILNFKNLPIQLNEEYRHVCLKHGDIDYIKFIYIFAKCRAVSFNLTDEICTEFEVAGIVKNIIPSIASVNSIVASVQALYLTYTEGRETFFTYPEALSDGSVLSTFKSMKSDNKCFVCRYHTNIRLSRNSQSLPTQFTDKILANIDYTEYSILSLITGHIIYEIEDDEISDLTTSYFKNDFKSFDYLSITDLSDSEKLPKIIRIVCEELLEH